MSSSEGHNDGDTSSGLLQMTKKPRIRRACDRCRRKKIGCDGTQMPENRCTNCISCRSDCTYVESAKKRSVPKGYVDSLENRMETLEKLLRRLCPNEALFQKLHASLDGNWTSELPSDGNIATQGQPDAVNLETGASAIHGAMGGNSDTTTLSVTLHDDDPTLGLAEDLKRMGLAPNDSGFLGKSSEGMLVRTAVELKNEYTGDDRMFRNQRAEFWGVKSWEWKSDSTASPKYNFPDFDLALHCIDLYFEFCNLYQPLLHRPTFDRDVEKGLCDTNESFAAVFLLVCAVGARYSDDPRVLLDGVNTHSAGWKWFEQVQIMKRSLPALPSLYDLQLYCLCAHYLMGSSVSQTFWIVAGIGIRLAQSVGAHRRKGPNHTRTPEDELWKRAFWVLLCSERMASANLGRSSAIPDDDLDLDLPVDCDDEYWDNPDPEKRFKQPSNKPSSVTAFILYIKLHRILAFSLRTVYSINKPKILLGFVGQPWQQHVVTEMDSALNKWVDSVPDHLRWDPNREDDNSFNQSVFLYTTYYYIQMIIHRPFISSPRKPSPLSFPSLAICTNAARSCSHIVDIQRKRNSNPPPQILMPAFTAGTVLLMNLWDGKRAGLSTDPVKKMADVHNCMAVLKTSNARWYFTGKLGEVLYSLTCKGELPLPHQSPTSTKRQQEPSASASELSLNPMPQNKIPRAIAGSRRVRTEYDFFIGQTQQPQAAALPPLYLNLPPLQQAPLGQSLSQIQKETKFYQPLSTTPPLINDEPPVFALPVYSTELGSFPLHGQVTFSAQAHHLHPQTHSPQLEPWTNDWYTMLGSPVTQDSDRSDLTPHRGPSRSLGMFGSSSLSQMGSMLQGPHGMNTEQLATSMTHDSVVGTLAYAQQHTSTYGLELINSLNPGLGLSSTIPRSSQSGLGSSIENAYEGIGVDLLPDLSGGHQHLGCPQPQEQQLLTHPFVDNGTADLWLNALARSDDGGIYYQ